ncbi:MAG TPA: O-methyltransferase [Gemmatimonadales bacterium]
MDGVGDYIRNLFAPEDATLVSLREEADRSGLPPIAISADAGRLLQLLIVTAGARRVLEVGTLGGYSAIWMARALPPDGSLVTLEREPAHAAFARRQLERAGLAGSVEVREGEALDLLAALDGERFDLVFLDADKAPLPIYLDWALRLLGPGGLVVADNALRGGRVLDPSADDPDTAGVREFNRRLATDQRLTSILVPTHDGVAVGVVRG